jgi:hypothetical protein
MIFTDDFNDNSRNAAMWVVGNHEARSTTGTTVTESSGQLNVALAVSTADSASGYISAQAYDVTDGEMSVRLVTAPNVSAFAAEAQFMWSFDTTNSVGFVIYNGNLAFRYTLAGTNTAVGTVTYSATTHAWLRVKHNNSDNKFYFYTAPSSFTSKPGDTDWTLQGSVTAPFGVTSMGVFIGGAVWSSMATPGSAVWDNFSLSGSVALNTTQVTGDMTLAHMAEAHGINPAWSWGTNPRVGIGTTFPGDWSAPHMVPWGIVASDAAGDPSTNTRVQIRRMILDVKRAGVWSRICYYTNQSKITGALYLNYETNETGTADIRNHGDDGISVLLPTAGGSFHFFTSDRFPVAAGAEEIVTRLETRLILDNPAGTDDRGTAKILTCCGGDVWRSATALWSSTEYNNDDFAIGRFKYVTNDWQEFSAHTLSGTTEINNYMSYALPQPLVTSESTKRVKLDSSAGGYPRIRSASSISHSGTFDQTWKVRFVAQNAGMTDLWNCPYIRWCQDATMSDSVGYYLQLMTDGYQLYKNGTVIWDYWDVPTGLPINGSEHTYRVKEVSGGWEIYRDGSLLGTATDASKLTSGYIGFSSLECDSTFDDLSGTLTQDFESFTTGTTYTTGDTFGNLFAYSTASSVVSIEATGARVITVTPATFSVSTSNVNLNFGRKLTVTAASITWTRNSVNMAKGYTLTVTTSAVTWTRNNVNMIFGRLLSVTAAGYTMTANVVNLYGQRSLSVTAGSYAVSTSNVTLTYTPATSWTLSVTPASIAVSANSVNLSYSQLPGGGGLSGATILMRKGRR